MKFEELEPGMLVQDIACDVEDQIGIVIECNNIHDVIVVYNEEDPEEDFAFYCFDEDCDDYCGDDLVKAEPKTGLNQLSNSLKNLHKNTDEEY